MPTGTETRPIEMMKPDPARDLALRVEAVSHRFSADATTGLALDNVSLDVAAGEMICLIGPSGCGKSTLLNIMGGLVTPSEGRVLVGDREVRGPRPDDIAFVFQENVLFPWNPVLKNLEIALEFRNVPPSERRARALAALSSVGMADFAQHYPDELSGGMKQRVALASALSLETGILLMDEPFAALDEQTRMILGEDLSQLLGTAGKTIVFVTHSLSEAVFLADRVVVMTARPGHIKAIVEVPEPHPRSPDFMTDPRFSDLRTDLYKLLRDEIRRAVPL